MSSTKQNVTVSISNQSFTINPVDIAVKIDGKTVASGTYDVSGEQPAQHNWQSHNIEVEAGPHEVAVTSKKGAARLKEKISIEAGTTISIAYWSDSKQEKKTKGYFTIEGGKHGAAKM